MKLIHKYALDIKISITIFIIIISIYVSTQYMYTIWFGVIPIIALIFGIFFINNFNLSFENDIKKYEKGNFLFIFLLSISSILLLNIFLTSTIIELIFEEKLYGRYFDFNLSLIDYFSLSLISPILEELLFRKVILQKLLTKYSFKKSIIFTSIYFYLIFILSDNSGFLMVFLSSFVLCIFYLRTRNLLACIIIRISSDIMIFSLLNSDFYNTVSLNLSIIGCILGILCFIVLYTIYFKKVS